MLEDFDVETMDTTGKIDFYFGPASSSMAANASKVMNANFDLVPMVLPTKTHWVSFSLTSETPSCVDQ